MALDWFSTLMKLVIGIKKSFAREHTAFNNNNPFRGPCLFEMTPMIVRLIIHFHYSCFRGCHTQKNKKKNYFLIFLDRPWIEFTILRRTSPTLIFWAVRPQNCNITSLGSLILFLKAYDRKTAQNTSKYLKITQCPTFMFDCFLVLRWNPWGILGSHDPPVYSIQSAIFRFSGETRG